MDPVILDGKTLAAEIKEQLKGRVEALKAAGKPAPTLATILVGDDPASATYVKMKGKACEQSGLHSRKIELPAVTSTGQLLDVIDDLNSDDSVNGILLQHPVPEHIDERACFDRITPAKDVDGVTTLGFGQISFGLPAYPSCTPAGIMRLLDHYKIEIEGKHAVVVGRSPILGKPMAALLLNRNATVSVCHSRTRNLDQVCMQADILIAAVGKPELVRGEWLKEGAVLIDAGYNPGNIGDAHYESCYAKASYITPVPGGVGPMTIAMLLEHTVHSAEN